jgi:hypothetical protein
VSYGTGVEPEPPTHILTVVVPFRLHGGPFDGVPVQDAIKVILSLCRCAVAVCDSPQVTFREAEHADGA